MENITFTCTKSAKDIEKALRLRPFFRGVVVVGIMIIVGCVAVPLVFLFRVVLNSPNWWQSEMFWPFIILLVTAMVLFPIVRYLIGFVIHDKEIAQMEFDIMLDKTFGWDEDKKQFVYSDKYRTLRFYGEDVEKWVSIQAKYGSTTDIMRLRNGEQIVLEDFFNPEIYPFLHENEKELGLPKSKRICRTVNYYKDPI